MIKPREIGNDWLEGKGPRLRKLEGTNGNPPRVLRPYDDDLYSYSML